MFSVVSVRLPDGRFNNNYFPVRLPDGSFNNRQKYLGTHAEWAYNNVFGTHGEALPQAIRDLSDKHEGLWYAADYWLDLLEETCHLALESKVASLTNMLHMVDIIWTSLKHILHIMEMLEESLEPDLAQMLVKSDEIMARGWWDDLLYAHDLQVSAVEFCQQHLREDDSDSDDESESEVEAEDEAEVEDAAEDAAENESDADYLSGQSTPTPSEVDVEHDGMSIENDHDMSIEDDEIEIGSDEYTPDSKTYLDWIIVYVYIKNEGDMKDLLKKMNDQLGKTMQKLIDKCLFDVK